MQLRSIVLFLVLFALHSGCKKAPDGTGAKSVEKPVQTQVLPIKVQVKEMFEGKNFWHSPGMDFTCPTCAAASEYGQAGMLGDHGWEVLRLIPLDYFLMPDDMKGRPVRAERSEGLHATAYMPGVSSLVYYREWLAEAGEGRSLYAIEFRLPRAWFTFRDSDGDGFIDDIRDEEAHLHEKSTLNTVFLKTGTELRGTPEGPILKKFGKGVKAEMLPELSDGPWLAILYGETSGFVPVDSLQEVEPRLRALLDAPGSDLGINGFSEHLDEFGYESWIDAGGFESFLMYETRTYDPSAGPRIVLFFYEDRLATLLSKDHIDSPMFPETTTVRGFPVAYRKDLDASVRNMFEASYFPIIQAAD